MAHAEAEVEIQSQNTFIEVEREFHGSTQVLPNKAGAVRLGRDDSNDSGSRDQEEFRVSFRRESPRVKRADVTVP